MFSLWDIVKLARLPVAAIIVPCIGYVSSHKSAAHGLTEEASEKALALMVYPGIMLVSLLFTLINRTCPAFCRRLRRCCRCRRCRRCMGRDKTGAFDDDDGSDNDGNGGNGGGSGGSGDEDNTGGRGDLSESFLGADGSGEGGGRNGSELVSMAALDERERTELRCLRSEVRSLQSEVEDLRRGARRGERGGNGGGDGESKGSKSFDVGV
jgi:hypothetical protein